MAPVSVEERDVKEQKIRKMALELDRMEKSVTSDEAELLEAVLVKTKEHKPLTLEEADRIVKMHDRYLVHREEGRDGAPDEESFGPDENDFDGE